MNVIVTGANTGIGFVTARELARRGMHVFVACRDPANANAAVVAMRQATGSEHIEPLALDLASLASVRAAAATFLARGLPLHLLINNAGVGGQRGITQDGFELHFGINHLGHFLLTSLLLARLRESAPARVVVVSSKAHYEARGIDWNKLKAHTRSITGVGEYEVSKLCNVLFTQALARRIAGSGVETYALHPGVVASDAWRRMPWPVRPLIKLGMISVEEGAKTSLYCATEPGLSSGSYYDECKPKAPNPLANDEVLQEELWRRSEAWIA